MLFDSFLQQISSPALRAVAQHWNEARGAHAMPGWADLRPASIAAQLSQIWAFRFDPQTQEFTARLAGDRIVRGFGRSFRGVSLKELHPPESFPMVQRGMVRVVCEPALYHLNGALFRQKDRTGNGERIMLPLAADGVRGDGVLGVSAVSTPFGNSSGAPIELLSEGESWFPLARFAAVA